MTDELEKTEMEPLDMEKLFKRMIDLRNEVEDYMLKSIIEGDIELRKSLNQVLEPIEDLIFYLEDFNHICEGCAQEQEEKKKEKLN